LTLPGHETPVTSLAEINEALSEVGAKLWPLDLGQASGETQRLLEIVSAAGRMPQIPGGGELTTLDKTHEITYPQLYQVEAGVDYRRFDRFHVNLSDDGAAVDEVMQVLSGVGIRFNQHLPRGGDLVLELGCPDPASGWILTYDGAIPHVGSISGCSAGSKILMQVIGPGRWVMRYDDEAWCSRASGKPTH
jgi:hypothetical protein